MKFGVPSLPRISATFVSFLLFFVLPLAVWSETELSQVRDSDQLATFIYQKITQPITPEELLDGIHSSGKITLPGFPTVVPVKEVYGTIVSERFRSDLDSGFYKRGKKYDVRGICTFRDAGGTFWRFNIVVFDQDQYRAMEQLLKKRISSEKNPK